MDSLRKTPLWEEHKALKARLVPFAGYDMPVQYSGIVEEHKAVREGAGIFDVSHMGFAELKGDRVRDFLNHLLTRDFSKLPPGKAAYCCMCREDGGTLDDLIVYCESDKHFFAVLNAGNKEKDLAHLRDHAARFEVRVDGPLDVALIALQGPKAFEILSSLGDKGATDAFTFRKSQLAGIDVRLALTGYTGERGCEIIVPSKDAAKLWRILLEKGAKPVGLGARDTLRTEMGYSLYGHELLENINPVEAGLSWVVGWKKENFIGKAALDAAKAHPKRKLVCLKVNSRQAPRPEMRVYDSRGQDVGWMTSGTFAPSLGYSIGMALVDAASVEPFSVDIRGTKVAFETTTRPFYKKDGA
jgi:aminomethyltransferase